MKEEVTVKNIAKSPKMFRDQGQVVVLAPGESVKTRNPPGDERFFQVGTARTEPEKPRSSRRASKKEDEEKPTESETE
jgi:hypothetical protein